MYYGRCIILSDASDGVIVVSLVEVEIKHASDLGTRTNGVWMVTRTIALTGAEDAHNETCTSMLLNQDSHLEEARAPSAVLQSLLFVDYGPCSTFPILQVSNEMKSVTNIPIPNWARLARSWPSSCCASPRAPPRPLRQSRSEG